MSSQVDSLFILLVTMTLNIASVGNEHAPCEVLQSSRFLVAVSIAI